MVTFAEQSPPTATAHTPMALILPGAGYTTQAPLLFWTAAALIERGWRVVRADWGVRPASLDEGRALVRSALEDLTGKGPDLVVAKSIGTFALPWAVERGVAGVWFTPLLSEQDVAGALAAADSRHFAVGGTSDPAWVPSAVTSSGAALRSVDGADHGLELPSSWASSARGQITLVEAAVEHAEGIRPA